MFRSKGMEKGGHVVDLLFTLALFCVFAASALVVVVIGAGVYQNAVEQNGRNMEIRASASYLSNKIRQHDEAGAVGIDALETGEAALVLDQEIGGYHYRTWIYCHNGALRELFVPLDTEILPETGARIVDAQGFSLTRESSLMELQVVDSEGVTHEIFISLRCEA